MIPKKELLSWLAALPYGDYGLYMDRQDNMHTEIPRHTLEIGNDTRNYSDSCCKCGGIMCGNGHTMPRHCEFSEVPDDAECDSGPWYCDYEPDARCSNVEFMLKIMEYSECGVMMHAFIIERMLAACAAILDDENLTRKQMHNNAINPDLWIACAKEFNNDYRETFNK